MTYDPNADRCYWRHCEGQESHWGRTDFAGRGVGSMDRYIVLYREAGDEHPADPPLLFHCQADDGDHAEEQCTDANPACTVVWTYCGSDWKGAFDDYYGLDDEERD